MLTTDQTALPVVSSLPTRGSWGQLLVQDSPASPGRSVEADQDAQKKNAVSADRSAASGRVSATIAYCSRSTSRAGSAPNRAE